VPVRVHPVVTAADGRLVPARLPVVRLGAPRPVVAAQP